MVDEGQHAACVDEWLGRTAKGLSSEALLRLFEAAIGAVWTRTKTTLGEVTLTAIAERVLHNASEKFSLLWSLKVEPTGGIQCRELRDRIGSVQLSELREALRFVLVELLTVIGNLTAEILTPELHLEIYGIVLPEAIQVGKSASGQSTGSVSESGEGKKSWRK